MAVNATDIALKYQKNPIQPASIHTMVIWALEEANLAAMDQCLATNGGNVYLQQ
jgi:hypothetical protein